MRFLLVLLVTWVVHNEAKNILLLSPIGSRSHKNFFMSVLKVLAEEGHQVTVVSTHANSKPMDNIRDIVLPTASADTFVRDVFGDPTKPIWDLLTKVPEVCTDGLLTPEVRGLKNEEFDLIIFSLFFSECYLSLVHHFKVPFAFISPAGLFGNFYQITGNVYVPSIIPNKLLAATPPLTYLDRLQSTIVDLVLFSAYELYTIKQIERVCRERGACPPDMPSLPQFFSNSSLTILNSVKTMEKPIHASMVNTIYAGGLHCVKAKPLPKDLEDWFQGSGSEGVIFFSLGSAVTPSDMPDKHRELLMKTFGSLKQRVLWKWDHETMDNLPANVKLQKWLPQQDILGHPKTRMFITHGGLLSTMEATYHGCPILGMPLFADQYNNIHSAVTEGWADSLFWKDLTEEGLKAKITNVLNNKSLQKNIETRAALMNDRLVEPKEEVSYWLNYVLRYDGATHLRSPIADMSWYELYNVDVWASIAATVGFVLYMFGRLLKYLCSFFISKRQIQAPKKHKRQ